MKVENVVKKGKVGDELVNGEEELMALNQWAKSFTPKRHPSLIKVFLPISFRLSFRFFLFLFSRNIYFYFYAREDSNTDICVVCEVGTLRER